MNVVLNYIKKIFNKSEKNNLSKEFVENYKEDLSLLYAHNKGSFTCKHSVKKLEKYQQKLYRIYKYKSRVPDSVMNRSYTI
jgi:hypothetical protein